MSIKLPSNRSFGGLLTIGFTLIGLYSLFGGRVMAPWLFGLAGLSAALTVTRPQWLAPLNRAWMTFGALLHRAVSPVVLGAIFFAVFTPVGFVMRMTGRDIMKRRLEPAAPTYWVERDPPGPAADSFRDQF